MAIWAGWWGLFAVKPVRCSVDLYPTFVAGRLLAEGHPEAIYRDTAFARGARIHPLWKTKVEALGLPDWGTCFVYSPWYLILATPWASGLTWPQFQWLAFLINLWATVVIGLESWRRAGITSFWGRCLGTIVIGMSMPVADSAAGLCAEPLTVDGPRRKIAVTGIAVGATTLPRADSRRRPGLTSMHVPSPALAYRRLVRSPRPWLLLEVVCLAVFCVILTSVHKTINHDCALLVKGAQWILDGKRFYRDFFDINPPWIVFLNVPHVWVARTFGLPATVTFTLFVQALFLTSVVQVRLLLGRLEDALAPSERGTLVLGWMVANAVAALRNDFGQRDHLFVMAVVPWAILRLIRHEGGQCPRWLSAWVGLSLGLTLCLKPYFFLPPVALELVLWWSFGKARPRGRPGVEWVTALVPLALYALYFLGLSARELDSARWHLWLVVNGYGAYSDSPWVILGYLVDREGFTAVSIFVGLVWTWIVCRLDVPLRALASVLVVLTASGFLLILIQSKNYTYHRVLLIAGAVMLAFLSAVVARRGTGTLRRGGRLRCDVVLGPCGFAVGAMVLAVTAAVTGNLPRQPGESVERRLAATIDRWSRGGDTVFFIDTAVWPAYPLLVKMSREPGTRYLYCYPIAFLGHASRWWAKGGRGPYPALESLTPEERRFSGELVEDATRSAPRMILIRRPRSQACPGDFDLREFLTRTGFMERVVTPAFREVEECPEFFTYVGRTARPIAPAPNESIP